MSLKILGLCPVTSKLVLVVSAALLLALGGGCRRVTSNNNNDANKNTNTAGQNLTPTPTPVASPTATATVEPENPPPPTTPDEKDKKIDERVTYVGTQKQAFAHLVVSDAWINRFRRGRVQLFTQPEKELFHNDDIGTDDGGEASVRIARCSTIYIFKRTELKQSPCARAERSGAAAIACLLKGTLRYFNRHESQCDRTVRIETDNARIDFTGTYADVTYYPNLQKTFVQLRSGKAEVYPVVDPGGNGRLRTYSEQPIELLPSPIPDNDKGCVLIGKGAVPVVEGVPPQTAGPCFKFPVPVDILTRQDGASPLNPERAAETATGAKQPVTPGELGSDIRITPDEPDFHRQPLGVRKELELTARNYGREPLIIKEMKLDNNSLAEFEVMSDPCKNKPIESKGEGCKFKLAFTPKATGYRTATLNVSHNATDKSLLLSVDGFGDEAPPPKTASDIRLDISPSNGLFFRPRKIGTPETLYSTITNPGPANVTVKQVSISGGGNEAFVFDNQCRTPLKAGDSCKVGVTFTPRSEASTKLSLSVEAVEEVAGGKPLPLEVSTYNLSGGGGTLPRFRLSSTEMCFKDKWKALKESDRRPRTEESRTVTNDGQADLAVKSVQVNSDDFTLVRQDCTSKALPPGGSCTVTVGFTPQGKGLREGALSITHDDPKAAPGAVTLKGVGTARNPFVRAFDWLFRRNKSPCRK